MLGGGATGYKGYSGSNFGDGTGKTCGWGTGTGGFTGGLGWYTGTGGTTGGNTGIFGVVVFGLVNDLVNVRVRVFFLLTVCVFTDVRVIDDLSVGV